MTTVCTSMSASNVRPSSARNQGIAACSARSEPFLVRLSAADGRQTEITLFASLDFDHPGVGNPCRSVEGRLERSLPHSKDTK